MRSRVLKPAEEGSTLRYEVRVPKTTKGGQRRIAIIGAASSVFDAEGYHRATMDRIAEASGMAKPTLYHYFRSKNEILYEMHQELISELIEYHGQRLQDGATPSELLVGVLGDVLELLEDRRGQVRVFFENSRELSEEQRALVNKAREEYTTMVEGAFREGVRRKEFRKVDAVLATRALFGMGNFAYQWFRPDGPLSALEVAVTFWAMFGDGIVRPSVAAGRRSTPSKPMTRSAPGKA
jgi:AcrR family transcriptional regulator